jgi:hypothetical protein
MYQTPPDLVEGDVTYRINTSINPETPSREA